MARAVDELRPRERQVLRFLATFVEVEGYLPSCRLIATECGMRSPSSAARIVRALESDGFVVRDQRRTRLAVIALTEPHPPVLQPDDELLLAHVTAVEIDAGLAADRAALEWAPDRAATAFVHRAALRRTDLARLYDNSIARLAGAGATVSEPGEQVLECARASAEQRVALETSWRHYCFKTALVEDALQAFLKGPRGLRRIHLQAAYEVELVQAAPTHPDLDADWSGYADDPELGPFWDAYTRSLQRVLLSLCKVVPALLADELVPAFDQLDRRNQIDSGNTMETLRAPDGSMTVRRNEAGPPCPPRGASA